MALVLSPALAEKAATFPESSHGACTVTVILQSGARIQNVVLAWGNQIVKIGGKSVASEAELGFLCSEIKDVVPQ
jgi:hypothetical protein